MHLLGSEIGHFTATDCSPEKTQRLPTSESCILDETFRGKAPAVVRVIGRQWANLKFVKFNLHGGQSMDVGFFLKQRTAFITHFFDEASVPFVETMRKIEAGEEPFEEQGFDPDAATGEPAFTDEWLRAQTGLEIIGQTAISMLSETLKIFFVTHEKNAGLNCVKEVGQDVFGKGFIRGYRTCFAQHGVDWSQCPVDFSILEQIVLARNASQHVSCITYTRANHTLKALQKHPSPIFVSEYERELMERLGGSWMIEPSVHVTREALEKAIEEVEKLASWLEGE